MVIVLIDMRRTHKPKFSSVSIEIIFPIYVHLQIGVSITGYPVFFSGTGPGPG